MPKTSTTLNKALAIALSVTMILSGTPSAAWAEAVADLQDLAPIAEPDAAAAPAAAASSVTINLTGDDSVSLGNYCAVLLEGEFSNGDTRRRVDLWLSADGKALSGATGDLVPGKTYTLACEYPPNGYKPRTVTFVATEEDATVDLALESTRIRVALYLPGSDVPVPNATWKFSAQGDSETLAAGDDGYLELSGLVVYNEFSMMGYGKTYGLTCMGTTLYFMINPDGSVACAPWSDIPEGWELDGSTIRLTKAVEPTVSLTCPGYNYIDGDIKFRVSGEFSDGAASKLFDRNAVISGLVPGKTYTVAEEGAPKNCKPVETTLSLTVNEDGTIAATGPAEGWSVDVAGMSILATHKPTGFTVDGVGPCYAFAQGLSWDWSNKPIQADYGNCRVGGEYRVYNSDDQGYPVSPTINVKIDDKGQAVATDPTVFDDPAYSWTLSYDEYDNPIFYWLGNDFVKAGAVEAADGSAVPGVTLMLTDSSGTVLTSDTDASGLAGFSGLTDGATYTLSCAGVPEGYAVSKASVDVVYHKDTKSFSLADGASLPDGVSISDKGVVQFEVEAAVPRLSISIENDDPTKTYGLGDAIYYTMTIRNEGDVAISDIAVGHPYGFCGTTPRPWTGITLDAGESIQLFGRRVVTADDIAAGTTLATAVTLSGNPKYGAFDDTSVLEASADATLEAAAPALEVTKTVDSEPADGVAYQVGEVVEYTIAVRNVGNVVVRDIEVEDPTADLARARASATIPSLAPGDEAEVACQHTVTEADVAEAAAREDRPNFLASTATARAAGLEAVSADPVDVPVAEPAADPEPGTDPQPGTDPEPEPKPEAKPSTTVTTTVTTTTTTTKAPAVPNAGDATAAAALPALLGACLTAVGARRRRR